MQSNYNFSKIIAVVSILVGIGIALVLNNFNLEACKDSVPSLGDMPSQEMIDRYSLPNSTIPLTFACYKLFITDISTGKDNFIGLVIILAPIILFLPILVRNLGILKQHKGYTSVGAFPLLAIETIMFFLFLFFILNTGEYFRIRMIKELISDLYFSITFPLFVIEAYFNLLIFSRLISKRKNLEFNIYHLIPVIIICFVSLCSILLIAINGQGYSKDNGNTRVYQYSTD